MLRFVSSACARQGSQRGTRRLPGSLPWGESGWPGWGTGYQQVHGNEIIQERTASLGNRSGWKKKCMEEGHGEMCKNAYIVILEVKDFNFSSQKFSFFSSKLT